MQPQMNGYNSGSQKHLTNRKCSTYKKHLNYNKAFNL